ncbi:MAG TPA: hypothetical protein VIS76_13270 [Pseudomonadales bacterium]
MVSIQRALLAVLLGGSFLFSAPARAEPSSEAAAAPAETQQEASDPRVCKRIKPVGSHIAQRYCFRQSTWDAMRENSQQAMREVSDRAAINTGSGERSR